MEKPKILSVEDVIHQIKQQNHLPRASFLAMYSSWYGGIIRDPRLMMIPVDDHVVHRGDGVFEAIKVVAGKFYALDLHLARLARSADAIGLIFRHSIQEIRAICFATVEAAGNPENCMLRLYCTRGPGNFSTNPYDVIGGQVYLVVTGFTPLAADKYERGVTARISQLNVKEGIFATIKSCNYLPNVLMKKEALDLKVDFTVSRDEQGNLAEGSTENFAIISAGGDFVLPKFSRILRGITAVCAMELAREHQKVLGIRQVLNASISPADASASREMMFLGTTIDCLPVTRFEGKAVGDGEVGPICRKLLELLLEDMRNSGRAIATKA